MRMKKMLIKKLTLALLVFDIIVILDYPTVYSGAYSLGGSTYHFIQLVLEHIR
jgi:hypothetical protein